MKFGQWLAGAGLIALAGYLTAAEVAGHRTPNWPYWLFGAITMVGAVTMLESSLRHRRVASARINQAQAKTGQGTGVGRASGEPPPMLELKPVLQAVDSLQIHKPSATSLASRLREAAGVFDCFAGEYGTRAQANESVEKDDGRTMLRARLVDLQEALDKLTDAELSTLPDQGSVVMVRTWRDSAARQVIDLRAALARNDNIGAKLNQLVASLMQLRKHIRDLDTPSA